MTTFMWLTGAIIECKSIRRQVHICSLLVVLALGTASLQSLVRWLSLTMTFCMCLMLGTLGCKSLRLMALTYLRLEAKVPESANLAVLLL